MKRHVLTLNVRRFKSDGPFTQYKNKPNFLLFRHYWNQLQSQRATWNSSTPGHGKNSADDTGGSLKELYNKALGHGKDVMSVEDMIEVIKRQGNGKIQIFPIIETDINFVKKLIPLNLKAIPNTRQIFDVNW